MTTAQLFFALAAVMGLFAGFFKHYLDAKIDPVAKQVDLLVKYMIDHESRISRLEAK